MNNFEQVWTGLIQSAVVLVSSSLIGLSSAASAEELTVVSFNVESGGSDPVVIATQQMAPLDGVDLWGFSEVQNEAWSRVFETGAEEGENADYRSILGTTGGGDRLAVIYNSELLEEVSREELDELSFGGRVRASLVVQFRLKQSSTEFLFVVSHLYRSEIEQRHEQAQLLNTWVQTQQLPVVAVGDYNFDFDVQEGDRGSRDEGFDLLTQGDAFVWVRPQNPVATFCSTRYDSILDFIFVANAAKNWTVESSEVLFADSNSGYCPDDETTSDHRPIEATFQISASGQPTQDITPSDSENMLKRLIQAIAGFFRRMQN